ncbi:MAG: hypothetical protein AAFN63_08410 [Pseudomonadota bacterium]
MAEFDLTQILRSQRMAAMQAAIAGSSKQTDQPFFADQATIAVVSHWLNPPDDRQQKLEKASD